MNAPIPMEAMVSIPEAATEDIEVAIEEAMGAIIDMHLNLEQQARDADEAMSVLHQLLVARVQIRKATSVKAPTLPQTEAKEHDDDPMYGAAVDLRIAAQEVERVWDNGRAAAADETLEALPEVSRCHRAVIKQLCLATKSTIVEVEP